MLVVMSASKITTRGVISYEIIDKPPSQFNYSSLPTNGDVLKAWNWERIEKKVNGREPFWKQIRKFFVSKLEEIWACASIPTVSTVTIFDICSCKCHPNKKCICTAERQVPKIEIKFLQDQRTKRLMSIGNQDPKNLSRSVKIYQKKKCVSKDFEVSEIPSTSGVSPLIDFPVILMTQQVMIWISFHGKPSKKVHEISSNFYPLHWRVTEKGYRIEMPLLSRLLPCVM